MTGFPVVFSFCFFLSFLALLERHLLHTFVLYQYLHFSAVCIAYSVHITTIGLHFLDKMRLEHFSYLLYMSSAYRDSTQLLKIHFLVC